MIFDDVFERLECEGVRYVVVGGVALALHGLDRPAADLDIVVGCAAAETERATRALAAAGFVPTLPLPLGSVAFLKMNDRARREIDVFARFYIPFAELLAGSERARSGNALVRVASVADIIRAKRLAGRPNDLRDIEQLLAAGRGGRSAKRSF